MTIKIVDSHLIENLCREAARSDRGRFHFNLHPELQDPVQRLCIAGNPGTYIRPHRHPQPDKWELFIVLRGSAAVLFFDDSGCVTDRCELEAGEHLSAVEIPPRRWHTLVITAAESVLMEIKPGPYQPTSEQDFSGWSPPEGSPQAIRFENRMRMAVVGSILEK